MSKLLEKQKLTLRLAPDVLDTAQDAVRAGIAPNVTAFIEAAVRAQKRKVRNARLEVLAAEAIADPDFVHDMRETLTAYAETDRKGWPNYDAVYPTSSESDNSSLGEAA